MDCKFKILNAVVLFGLIVSIDCVPSESSKNVIESKSAAVKDESIVQRKTITIAATDHNIKKLNEAIRSNKIGSNFELDCDTSKKHHVASSGQETVNNKLTVDSEKIVESNAHSEDGSPEEDKILSELEEPDVVGADYPIIHDSRKPQHIPNKDVKRPDDEDSVEDPDGEEEQENEPGRMESIRYLIRKLRKSGVSWNVIRRALYDRDHRVHDYPVVIPGDYYSRRRYRPYFGVYPNYRPYVDDYFVREWPGNHEKYARPRFDDRYYHPVYAFDEPQKKK